MVMTCVWTRSARTAKATTTGTSLGVNCTASQPNTTRSARQASERGVGVGEGAVEVSQLVHHARGEERGEENEMRRRTRRQQKRTLRMRQKRLKKRKLQGLTHCMVHAWCGIGRYCSLKCARTFNTCCSAQELCMFVRTCLMRPLYIHSHLSNETSVHT